MFCRTKNILNEEIFKQFSIIPYVNYYKRSCNVIWEPLLWKLFPVYFRIDIFSIVTTPFFCVIFLSITTAFFLALLKTVFLNCCNFCFIYFCIYTKIHFFSPLLMSSGNFFLSFFFFSTNEISFNKFLLEAPASSERDWIIIIQCSWINRYRDLKLL